MKIFFDCLPCLLRQALEAARLVTDSEDVQMNIMKEAALIISEYDKFKYSPDVAREIHQVVKKYTGITDPYKETKNKNIETALKVYPVLKRFLFKKSERLYWALKIAATGNIIDSAIYGDIDIENSVNKELEREFAVCDIEEFKSRLKNAKTLLIIGDNAGETVFDRVLIEELLHLDIIYAVRSEPVINDVTLEEAYASGIDRCATLMSSGCNAPGMILEECSEEFLTMFNDSDVIISKGQGNYESLSDTGREVFFLLKAKCPMIADRLNVDVGDYVFKLNREDRIRAKQFSLQTAQSM